MEILIELTKKISFKDLNKHFYDDYLDIRKNLIDKSYNTLSILRQFLYFCKVFKNEHKNKNKCIYGNDRIRVHDFDTRFSSKLNFDSLISYFLRLIHIQNIYIKKNSLDITPEQTTELIIGVFYFNKEYKNFDSYYQYFILPIYNKLKNIFSNYQNDKYFSIIIYNPKLLKSDLKQYFEQNTKQFLKIVNKIGKYNAKILYQRLFEYTKYKYLELNSIPDVYLILRLFSEFDFSNKNKKKITM